jgi:hypothetical protein
MNEIENKKKGGSVLGLCRMQAAGHCINVIHLSDTGFRLKVDKKTARIPDPSGVNQLPYCYFSDDFFRVYSHCAFFISVSSHGV